MEVSEIDGRLPLLAGSYGRVTVEMPTVGAPVSSGILGKVRLSLNLERAGRLSPRNRNKGRNSARVK